LDEINEALMSELLTVEDVAMRLHAEPSTIRAWIRLGALKGVKIGRRWLISENEVRRVANEGISMSSREGKKQDTKGG
jgi:excisionase family DNA binding protein